jgi:hypothetical protein
MEVDNVGNVTMNALRIVGRKGFLKAVNRNVFVTRGLDSVLR